MGCSSTSKLQPSCASQLSLQQQPPAPAMAKDLKNLSWIAPEVGAKSKFDDGNPIVYSGEQWTHIVPQDQKHPLTACHILFSLPVKIHIFTSAIKLRKITYGTSLLCRLPSSPPSKRNATEQVHTLLTWARPKGLIKGKCLWALVDVWTKTSQRAWWCNQLAGAKWTIPCEIMLISLCYMGQPNLATTKILSHCWRCHFI